MHCVCFISYFGSLSNFILIFQYKFSEIYEYSIVLSKMVAYFHGTCVWKNKL